MSCQIYIISGGLSLLCNSGHLSETHIIFFLLLCCPTTIHKFFYNQSINMLQLFLPLLISQPEEVKHSTLLCAAGAFPCIPPRKLATPQSLIVLAHIAVWQSFAPVSLEQMPKRARASSGNRHFGNKYI